MSNPTSRAASLHAAPALRPDGHAAPFNAWISLTLRGLEPWIAGAIALYTAWVNVFAFPGVPVLWLFVAYAALVALWCHARPAHLQWEVFLRGVALVAGGYVLHTHADAATGGPTGPYFFWLSITSLYYAFILSPAWGLALTLGAIGALLGASLQLNRLIDGGALSHLGFLAIFPTIIAMRFGVAMRRPDAQMERSRTDRSTALYNLRGLFEHGQDMLSTCSRDGKPLSMVLLDCADLQEIRTIYGASTGVAVMGEVIRRLQMVAGERGLVVRATATEFVLVLPRTGCEKSLEAVWRAFGKPARVECELDGDEIVMVPELLAQEVCQEFDTIAMAYTAMHDRMTAHREEVARRQRYLTRERERHSRPAALVPGPTLDLPTAFA